MTSSTRSGAGAPWRAALRVLWAMDALDCLAAATVMTFVAPRPWDTAERVTTPGLCAVRRPVGDTVATRGSLVAHVTVPVCTGVSEYAACPDRASEAGPDMPREAGCVGLLFGVVAGGVVVTAGAVCVDEPPLAPPPVGLPPPPVGKLILPQPVEVAAPVVMVSAFEVPPPVCTATVC